jgi:hypothetical protein
MSFYMDVELSDRLTWQRASALADECNAAGGMPIIKPRKPLLGAGRFKRLTISDRMEGQPILADDADWDAPTWAMRAELLPNLEVTLRSLCEHIPEGFGFVAAWVGDRIDREVDVSCNQLIEIVRSSGLNGRTRYRVRP